MWHDNPFDNPSDHHKTKIVIYMLYKIHIGIVYGEITRPHTVDAFQAGQWMWAWLVCSYIRSVNVIGSVQW